MDYFVLGNSRDQWIILSLEIEIQYQNPISKSDYFVLGDQNPIYYQERGYLYQGVAISSVAISIRSVDISIRT